MEGQSCLFQQTRSRWILLGGKDIETAAGRRTNAAFDSRGDPAPATKWMNDPYDAAD